MFIPIWMIAIVVGCLIIGGLEKAGAPLPVAVGLVALIVIVVVGRLMLA